MLIQSPFKQIHTQTIRKYSQHKKKNNQKHDKSNTDKLKRRFRYSKNSQWPIWWHWVVKHNFPYKVPVKKIAVKPMHVTWKIRRVFRQVPAWSAPPSGQSVNYVVDTVRVTLRNSVFFFFLIVILAAGSAG